ncbi:hypothetical protein P7K49_028089 [Saguinus oedipus]|uniref:mitogen-activated protein kinase n=1 Tax=Saguinus oedipus TaxID=9490 RepID=A0ABQ9UBI8_SAGOE|nr:hypothetical protein P7K49_028089 [Saguinus oedipus]
MWESPHPRPPTSGRLDSHGNSWQGEGPLCSWMSRGDFWRMERIPGTAFRLLHTTASWAAHLPSGIASPGAHELEQMQLILETIPVIREEDKEELLRVMPSFVSSTWEVKRPLRKLLPEVNSEGT